MMWHANMNECWAKVSATKLHGMSSFSHAMIWGVGKSINSLLCSSMSLGNRQSKLRQDIGPYLSRKLFPRSHHTVQNCVGHASRRTGVCVNHTFHVVESLHDYSERRSTTLIPWRTLIETNPLCLRWFMSTTKREEANFIVDSIFGVL